LIYEVWDTGTANQIGAFPTKGEAVALLHDVLRVNGPEVARDMSILSYSGVQGDDEPTLVLEGNELVERALEAIPVS